MEVFARFSQTAEEINDDKIKLANKHWDDDMKTSEESSDENWVWHCVKKGAIDDATS